MKFYPEQINKIVELITNGKLPYQDTILLGDNAVGKSEVVKQIARKLLDRETIYFIDAVNRYFSVRDINETNEKLVFSDSVIKMRLKDENFNLVDTWSYHGTMTERIETIYPYFEKEVQKMMKNFFGTTFSIALKETQEVRYNSGDIGKLSSGYQAILRMFLELLYVNETLKGKEGKKMVVIDEIDEYLSPKTAARLFPFLKRYFSELSFTATTHSADFIAAAENCNIVIMQQNSYEILDSNDFKTLDDVFGIFKDVFGNSDEKIESKEVERQLRRLVNNKIVGVWGEEEERQLASIKERDLSKAQRIIYRQIKEW